MKLLLFDVDGTLLLTGGAGKIAFEKAFEELFGVSHIWQDIIPDGKTDPLIIQELLDKVKNRSFSQADYDRLCKRYLHYFEIEMIRSERFRLMPGVENLMKTIEKRNDLVTGLATGNFEQAARLKLKKGGLEKYFPFGGYGSDSSSRTELTRKAIERGEAYVRRPFSKDRIYVLGDTVYDIRAGKDLGVKTVAIATGRTTRKDLALASPDGLFDYFPEPEEFFRALQLN